MPRIIRLPNDLANQIAAGEVVERPASVVKELVENALDAGATRVTVELEQGGLGRIRVTDDGEGMQGDDARLSVERHATSKLRDVEGLSRISTYGFRGEALPSIASVSKLTLVTRARGADEGTEVVLEGGGEPRVRPAGLSVGTSVDVADLFFNVPARRKFLKSQATEAAHVAEVVLAAALSHPEITFTLVRDGKTHRQYLRAPTRQARVDDAIAGERLAACIGERGPMKLEAYLSPPERARPGAANLHLYVNLRPVRSPTLARAVAQAYGSVLESGRYPVGVVYLTLPVELVDVNVHPQKAEVRFADSRALFEAVVRELGAGLAKAFSIDARREAPQLLPVEPAADPWGLTPRPPAYAPLDAARSYAPLHAAPRNAPLDMATATLAEAVAEPAPVSDSEFFRVPGFYARLRFLAQVRGTFLVCEGEDGLYVLDQHAAAERVTFDRLRRAYASRQVASQKLLIPELVELSPGEVAALEDSTSGVAAVGVELRAVGPSAVAVHAIPKLLARAQPERIVRDLAAELARSAKRPFSDAADLVLATMACHGSIRANDHVSAEEAQALLRALDAVDFAGHCPHGRPVVTRIPFDDLERRVGR
jgi:DNA mismatch repair protein MutL